MELAFCTYWTICGVRDQTSFRGKCLIPSVFPAPTLRSLTMGVPIIPQEGSVLADLEPAFLHEHSMNETLNVVCVCGRVGVGGWPGS